jgi:hypothetical protein
MADAADTETRIAHRDVKAELDERRIARGVAIGLPLVTASLAAIIGVTIGAPMAILVLASGMLLGVIALFWASLRILSGDAALSPELEALDATAHAVDALASRKTMLLRALKDLDNERALGKLEDEDYEQLSHTYRGELKDVLARIDATLEPHRPKAEDAARAYLVKAGLAEGSDRGSPAQRAVPAAADSESDADEDAGEDHDDESGDDESERDVAKATKVEVEKKKVVATKAATTSARTECAKCKTSNEVDASFCKKCGGSLATKNAKDTHDAAAEATDDAKEEATDEA